MKERVVVTGLGVMCSIGNTVEEFSESLFQGKSGAGPITLFDPASLATRVAAEVKLTSAQLLQLDGGRCNEYSWALSDRKVAFALLAVRQAMAQAFGSVKPTHSEKAFVSLGVGLELFSMVDLAKSKQPNFSWPTGLEKQAFLQTPSDVAAKIIQREYDLGAPSMVHVSACAAGTDSIGAAYRAIASGRRSWAIAGGTDSMVNPLGVGGFCTLSATTTRNHEPTKASRPFDRTRDGFLLGEGAAMLVLERHQDATARGAVLLGEILGYGNSFDAFGISEPHPDGEGALTAIKRALRDANVSVDEIDAINAHGTSTPKNDVIETIVYHRLLSDRAKQVPTVSTKSMIGHCISAAGSVEAVATLICMGKDRLHPTINLYEPDPQCDLDYVPNVARDHKQDIVLSNSYAFGGQNASIVLAGPRRANRC